MNVKTLRRLAGAARRARRWLGIDLRDTAGYCGAVSRMIRDEVEFDMEVSLWYGSFVVGENLYPHTCLWVERSFFVDGTVDQFGSFNTKSRGIYISHPKWDGEQILDCYRSKKALNTR